MSNPHDTRTTALLLLSISVIFFIMGMLFPIMETGYGLGPIRLRQEFIYLSSSFRYFFNKGEIFIGVLLLFFTILFPILKFLFLLFTLLGRRFSRHRWLDKTLELISKWSMLDVFVVALVIINMKFDSAIIISKLGSGTTLFAISVLVLMGCSYLTGRLIAEKEFD